MSNLIIHQKPEAKFDHLIVAFAGWPDAGESATSTIKYMLRQLEAVKFAEIDPEEFYDFSQERPRSYRTRDGRRRVRWPANEFYICRCKARISSSRLRCVMTLSTRSATSSSSSNSCCTGVVRSMV